MTAKCGTVTGYRSHLASGTPTCKPCCAADALRNKCWRIRTGRTTTVPLPVTYLAELLKTPEVAVHLRAGLGEDLCNAIAYACGKGRHE